MDQLEEPAAELVSNVLSEVGFEDRLIGYRLRERSGMTAITLYSFEEVVVLLSDAHPRLDFSRLEKWLRETINDQELAVKIKQVMEQKASDQEKSLGIRDLMLKRLVQCRKIA